MMHSRLVQGRVKGLRRSLKPGMGYINNQSVIN